jgi:hypothetical protein
MLSFHAPGADVPAEREALRALFRACEGGALARQTRHQLTHVLAITAGLFWCVVKWPALLPPLARSLLLAASAVVFLLLFGVVAQEWIWHRERIHCERRLERSGARPRS